MGVPIDGLIDGKHRVHVSTLAGQTCCVEADSDSSVRDVKEAISKAGVSGVSWAPEEQRLALRERVLKDRELVRSFCDGDCNVTLVRCPSSIIEWLQKNIPDLETADDAIRSDSRCVMVAVSACGDQLRFAARELRDERELVEAACRQKFKALRYASPRLQRELWLREWTDDRIHEEHKRNPPLIQEFAGVTSDAECALKAITYRCHEVRHVSQELRGNREIMQAAVRGDWALLGRASTELQRDQQLLQLVKTGILNDWRPALQEAPALLCQDWEVAIYAVSKDGDQLRNVADVLRSDRDIVDTALLRSPYALCYVPEAMFESRSFVLWHAMIWGDGRHRVPPQFWCQYVACEVLSWTLWCTLILAGVAGCLLTLYFTWYTHGTTYGEAIAFAFGLILPVGLLARYWRYPPVILALLFRRLRRGKYIPESRLAAV